jgi:hypothetical protein
VGPAVLEFAAGATGNVAPIATITGPATTITIPEGVAVAGPPGTNSATLSTSASASSISLGDSTSDNAKLAGGTSPTGSMVFKLFGPNDSTCSAAPAYTSPAQAVDGDGAYPSPSFVPTAIGTYYWQALYSGDSKNAAITTACDVPAETVTVTSTSCASGPWPKPVRGVPTVTRDEPRGYYIGVNGANGQWTLEVTHTTHDPRQIVNFDGDIVTNGTFTGVAPIGKFYSKDHYTVSRNQHVITFSLYTGGEVKGLNFTPSCGTTITLHLNIHGFPNAPTDEIYLGVPATHPKTNPMTFTRKS